MAYETKLVSDLVKCANTSVKDVAAYDRNESSNFRNRYQEQKGEHHEKIQHDSSVHSIEALHG